MEGNECQTNNGSKAACAGGKQIDAERKEEGLELQQLH
jgi:hypothetical protein